MKASHFSFSCHFKVVSSKVLVHHKARDQIFNLLQIKSFIVIAKLMKVPRETSREHELLRDKINKVRITNITTLHSYIT